MNVLKLTELRLKELVDRYNTIYPQEPITEKELIFSLLVEAVYQKWVRMKNGY